jgi:hypothetical protein
MSDRVMCVVTECSRHNLSIFPGMFGSGIASYPCGSGEGPHLVAKSHCSHPAVEQGSVPAHRGTRDRNGSLDEKEWFLNLCTAYSTENIHLRTVSHVFGNLVRIVLYPHHQMMAIYLP